MSGQLSLARCRSEGELGRYQLIDSDAARRAIDLSSALIIDKKILKKRGGRGGGEDGDKREEECGIN